jgi:hypothetical protein
VCGAALTISAGAQTDNGAPHLRKQGAATQLIVDGKPFLALAGELTNNAATSLPMMEPIWPKLVAANLNTALAGVSWAQFEPEEGTFNYTQINGIIAKARENHMRLVILWFGSWKNGTSSFAPYWVKKDYTRFPRIEIDDGSTVSISGPLELLSTFGDRLHGRVKRQQVTFLTLLRKRMNARVLPDVGSVPAELAELDVVPMRSFATPEDQDQLMPGAIEASHTAVVLYPHAQV